MDLFLPTIHKLGHSPSVHSLPQGIYHSKWDSSGKKCPNHRLPSRRPDMVIIDSHEVNSQHRHDGAQVSIFPKPLCSLQTKVLKLGLLGLGLGRVDRAYHKLVRLGQFKESVHQFSTKPTKSKLDSGVRTYSTESMTRTHRTACRWRKQFLIGFWGSKTLKEPSKP